MRRARRNDATVIAVTNRSFSTLAQEANFTFFTATEESALTGESAAARMAQLSIVDALFLAVARISPVATETNLGRTLSALRAQRAPW